MNFPSNTSSKIIMRDDAPFNFFWPIAGYFAVELCKVDVWNRIARALQPCGTPEQPMNISLDTIYKDICVYLLIYIYIYL